MDYDMIRDPVHGYVRINEFEKRLLDTEIVQRLRYLKQTPSVSYVYPGANHTRLEHALGVMHLVSKMLSNYSKLIGQKKMEELESGLNDEELKAALFDKKELEKNIQLIRLAALLHDIGHGPFSHTFEKFLEMKGIVDINHEHIGELIIMHRLSDEIKSCFKGHPLYDMIVDELDEIPLLIRDRSHSLVHLNGVLVGDIISADIIDFLLRDSHHSGVTEYGLIDSKRIIDNITWKLIGGKYTPAINERTAYALEDYMVSRYQMFMAVYYHKTARAIDLMFAEALYLASEELNELKIFDGLNKKELYGLEDKDLKNFLDLYLSMDDYSMISKLKTVEKSRRILDDITKRKHYKLIYRNLIGIKPDTTPRYEKMLIDPNNQRDAEEKIKKIAGNEDCKVRIDLPRRLEIFKTSRFSVFDKADNMKTLEQFIENSSKFKLIGHWFKDKSTLYCLQIFTDEQDEKKIHKLEEAAIEEFGEPTISTQNV